MKTILRENSGQVVWLSGASSGIGFALAELLLLKGFRVAVSARRKEPLQALAAAAPDSSAVLQLPLDVTDRAALSTAYQTVCSHWQVPDLVIANAGISIHMEADDLDYEKLKQLNAVNLLAAMSILQLPVQDMLKRGSGYLAGVASVAGYRGLPHAAGYVATKAGLIAFLDSLRFDLEPHGIAVSVINPGFVKTPLTDRNKFPMPFIISPEASARAIWRGLQKGRMEIHYPLALSLVLKLMRILPYPLYHALVRRGAKRRYGGKAADGRLETED